MTGARARIRTGRRRASSGFTIIEMVVVIAVILVLVALTVTVGVSVLRRAEVRDTETVVRLLDEALAEWQVQAGRQLRYGRENEPCNRGERYELRQRLAAGDSPSEADMLEEMHETTDDLISLMMRVDVVKDFIARIDPRFVEWNEEDEVHHFRDAWDGDIFAVLAGRPYDANCAPSSDGGTSGYWRDPDGTIRTPFENWFGVAADRRIFFVSAGPSGRFGNLRLNRTQAEINGNEAWTRDVSDASDNVYSYPVFIDQARPQ
jgi:prepilin-type N-terminal cleavage/methylation domain-containing protein